MPSFRSEPFLWIHLAGIAVAPLALLVTWLALAIGDPITPYGLELAILAIAAIIPILIMQWSRPFEIFSLLIISLRPEVLTTEQRKILRLFKTPKQRIFALLTALLMFAVLWGIYLFAPVAALSVTPFPQIRVLGLIIAAIAFLVANLFTQVPISVVGVLLTKQEVFNTVEPLTVEQIPPSFTVPGFRVRKIPFIPEATEAASSVKSV
ncbi:MAG: low-complexity tail membrane protein [Snowella sp.]|nr:low-complexity tail membrane protein [Snowella sp.]